MPVVTEHEEQRRAQQRQGDVAEPLPGAGAVDRGSLVQRPRHGLQPGEEDDHAGAEVAPRRHQDQRRHRPVRVAEPVRAGDADPAQHGVDQAEVLWSRNRQTTATATIEVITGV